MKKKSRNHSQSVFILVLIGIIICIAGFFWVRSVRENSITKTRFPMVVMLLDEAGKKYTVSGEYPLFSSDVTPLNNAIEKTVNDSTQEFVKTATTNWDERMANAQSEAEKPQKPFQYFLDWTPQQLNARDISFMIDINEYVGGANMTEDVVTFNWDVQNNKPVSLKDLFPNDPDYLEKISSYMKKELPPYLSFNSGIPQSSVQLFEEGIAPTEENFQRFVFNDDMITFYFPKGQIAPAVYGMQSIPMDRSATQ